MRDPELILYRGFEREEAALLADMSALMSRYGRIDDPEREPASSASVREDRNILYDCMGRLVDLSARRGFYGNLWHDFLTLLLVQNENTYSLEAEGRGVFSGTARILALHDMHIFEELFDYKFGPLSTRLHVPEFMALLDYQSGEADHSAVYNRRIRDRICHLADEIARCASAEEMLETVTGFYEHCGVGVFGLHKAFRVAEEGQEVSILPIRSIRHVRLDDLVGYEHAKGKLVENTEAFLAGRPANNCLLYGDAGTGKSTCIKALANEYFDRGLRVIELYKHQFRDINEVVSRVKSRNYRFILYMDDLSFEDFETEYKYLKAVIEGGLEKKPDNVLIYATSNRRHLIRESFHDKKQLSDDDIHHSDTVQEKLSLSARFGVTIYFGAPEPREYDEIVRSLAARAGLSIDDETLLAEARKWEMSHGGLSGRTAQQYIDHLAGCEA